MKKALGWIIILSLILGFSGTAFAGSNEMRYSIMVSEFQNRSNWRGQWRLGDAWGAILTDSLNNTGRFIVLGEKSMRQDALNEQDFAASDRAAGGGKKVVKGQMTPAQLLIKGDITHFDSGTAGGGGGFGIKGFKIGVKGGTTEINAVMYTVDSSTGQVLADKKVYGKITKKGLSLGFSKSGYSGNVGGFKKTNEGKAMEMAIDQGVEFLISKLEDMPWTGTVILVKKKKIYINRGEREGVTVGQTFDVGELEILRDTDTGEVLDQEMELSGKIEVVKIKKKIAICKVIEGDVQKGMTILLPD